MTYIPRALSALRSATLPALAVALTLLNLPPVSGEPAAAAAESASQSTNQVAPTSPDAALKSIRDAAHRLRKASLDVINDIEERDMVVTGEPMLIQPIAMNDDDKPVGWAQKMEDLGPALPPKKQWLDMDVGNVGDLVTLIVQDVNAVTIPQYQSGLQGPWGDLKAVVQDMQTHYASLKELARGPKYDNIAIGKEALKIFDDVKRLEAPWKAALTASRAKS